MRVKRFEVAGLAQYFYVVSSEGKAVVIDPMCDFDPYVEYAIEHDLDITYVIETHIHAGFASGALAFARSTGSQLAVSSYDQKSYRYSMEHQGDDENSRRSLARVGLDNIEGFLRKGVAAWVNAGMEFTRTMQLSSSDVADRKPDTQVLDVRSEREWASGHIDGSFIFPLRILRHRIGELREEARSSLSVEPVSLQPCSEPASVKAASQASVHGWWHDGLE